MIQQLGTHSSPQGLPGGSSLQRYLEGFDLDFERPVGCGEEEKTVSRHGTQQKPKCGGWMGGEECWVSSRKDPQACREDVPLA